MAAANDWSQQNSWHFMPPSPLDLELPLEDLSELSVTDLPSDSTAGCLTPAGTFDTRSMASEPTTPVSQYPFHHEETVPCAGGTYMIEHYETGLHITMVEGKLQMRRGTDSGSHWVCVEKDGWFGFRNPVSGKYIGHDANKSFWAKVSHHKEHEYFVAKKIPDGGYELMVLHGWKFRKMDICEGTHDLVQAQSGRWSFVKVE